MPARPFGVGDSALARNGKAYALARHGAHELFFVNTILVGGFSSLGLKGRRCPVYLGHCLFRFNNGRGGRCLGTYLCRNCEQERGKQYG